MDKEHKRNLFHAALGILLIVLLYYNIVNGFILFIVLCLGLALSFTAKHYHLPGIQWFLDNFERRDIHPGKGAICYFIGVILAVYLFPKDIALASIAILAVGDSLSHYIGSNHGTIKHPLNKEKLIEGSIAGTLAGFLAAWLFVSAGEAFLAAIIAMIAEAIEIELNNQLIDDNISIPLVAGVVISLMRKFVP